MSEWISVKDRIPDGAPVLVVYHGVVQWVTYRLVDGGWESTSSDDTMPLGFVTHWQPLPEPPK
jgi:hypothetical protein